MNFSDYSGRWDRNRGVIDCARWLATTLVALAFAFTVATACGLLFGGCANVQRARQVSDQASLINRAHEADEQLPASARMIAADSADLFEVIRWSLGGRAPSLDAQQRINERRKARGEEPLTFQ